VITEETIVDQITAQWLDATPEQEGNPALPARWVVNVRRCNRVLRDGVVIARELHRHVIEIDQVSPEELKREDEMVQKVCAAIKQQK